MAMDGVPSNARLAELGVARISYGPIPFLIHDPGDGVYSVLGRIPDPAEDRP
jgi:hypothetical protein